MNIYIILTVAIMIIFIMLLLFFISYTKLKSHKDKISKAENIIDDNLNKKLNIIISINGCIKEVSGKKDYLKDYLELNNFMITNNEKDLKLEEAMVLIEKLKTDYVKLEQKKDFIKAMQEIKEIDEILHSAKQVFNNTAYLINKMIKIFPNNLVAKITNIKARSFYNITKVINEEF